VLHPRQISCNVGHQGRGCSRRNNFRSQWFSQYIPFLAKEKAEAQAELAEPAELATRAISRVDFKGCEI